MGVGTVEPRERARSRLLEADVENEPAVPVGEEVLDRVGPLAARARGADLRVERQERRLEVAAWSVAALTGAQRFPPTVACARISRSATFAAHGPSGAASSTRS